MLSIGPVYHQTNYYNAHNSTRDRTATRLLLIQDEYDVLGRSILQKGLFFLG
jgi:hypothetical protein